MVENGRHEEQATAIEGVPERLSEHGLGAMAEVMQTLLNEAMKLERSELLRAAPGERTSERTAYANGFTGKRGLSVTPHVAPPTTKRSSRIDGRTTRHPGYTVS